MGKSYTIKNEPLTIDTIDGLVKEAKPIALSKQSKALIIRCRRFLEKKISGSDDLFYGINTGFGALCNVHISPEEIAALQENLVLSHAAGTGDPVPSEIVKLMLFLKIHALSLGHSGVRKELIDRMINLYNNDVIPVLYQQGSLGASGDLAPLAHLSLPLIGKGEVYLAGKVKKTKNLVAAKTITPLTLDAKEGLALLNGTQFMSAYGVWGLLEAKRLVHWAEMIAAISIDAFDARLDSFLPFTHRVRPHAGQVEAAEKILALLEGSEISAQAKDQVQDPYSFRCIPQVFGAVIDTIAFVRKTIEVEINAVTDNPILFPDEDLILSGGNFHGEPVAFALDFLTISMSEIGSISERRIYLLQSGQRGLPPFLTGKAGLHSGLMIAQYTAASIVSQNKQKCTPASADSITSSNGQEDHVSMGANAATKMYEVLQNVKTILAIELLCAVQALTFKRPLKTSPVLEKVVKAFQAEIPFREKDREVYTDINKSRKFLERL